MGANNKSEVGDKEQRKSEFDDGLKQLSFFPENYEMAKVLKSLGMIETKGFIALIEASDAMLKAADVTYLGWDKVGSGLVSAFVAGDVAAVKAATDAGANAASRVGEVVSVQVVPRPHEDLPTVLPKLKFSTPAGK